MADSGMVALREALGKILETEHADLLREGVALLYRELMEAEVAEQAGAERYERSEERVSYRNGYRPRGLNTRVGSIELAIPKLRSGSYFPSFLEPRKRSEQALLSVVAEAYVNGVSTRKVERVVEQLGVDAHEQEHRQPHLPAARRARRGLPQPAAGGRLPVPVAGCPRGAGAGERRRHGAPEGAAGGLRGARDGPARGDRPAVGEVESEAEWRDFLRELVARGLTGVQLVISDAHQGLKNAIGQVLGAQWQRCAVHFVRDMLGHVPRTDQPLVRGALKQVFAAPDRQSAGETLAAVVEQLEPARRQGRAAARGRRGGAAGLHALPARALAQDPLARTRWSGSTWRSPAEATSSASTPTTPPCCVSPPACWWSRTTSG